MTQNWKFGYRELHGCLPPRESPSKFRLFWRQTSDVKVILFTQQWIKDFDIWAPCDSTIRIVNGGSRVPLSQFDRGHDSLHTVILYGPCGSDDGQISLSLQVEVRDHRSFQHFSEEQLSNYEGELVADAVECPST